MTRAEHSPVRVWTEGPVFINILHLAWPVVASQLLATIMSLIDMFFLGRLGTAPVAGVVSGMFSIWLLFSAVEVLATGITALVSRAVGEGNTKKAAEVASQALAFGVLLGLVLTVAGWFLAPLTFKLMHTSAAVTHAGLLYLRTVMCVTVLIVLDVGMGAVVRASGDTRTAMWVDLVAILLHILVAPFFILGAWGFPRLGAQGAALGMLASYGASVVIYGWLIHRKKLRIPLTLKWPRQLNPKIFWQVIKIGAPRSISAVVFCCLFFFVNQVVVGYGDYAVAALGMGLRMESISYLFAGGIGTAAATLVGQNLGAGRPDRAERSAWYCAELAMVWTAVVGIAMIVFRDPIAAAFLRDPLAQDSLQGYLIIVGAAQVFMGLHIVLVAAFSGAGNTLPASVVEIPGTILRLPLCYFFAHNLGLGPLGVWAAIAATMFLKGVAVAFWFAKGHWKKHKLDVAPAAPLEVLG